METHQHNSVQPPQTVPASSTKSPFESRPFAKPLEEFDRASTPIDLQAQLDRAARYGHNLSQINVIASPPEPVAPQITLERQDEQETSETPEPTKLFSSPIQRQEDFAPTHPLAPSLTPVIQRQDQQDAWNLPHPWLTRSNAIQPQLTVGAPGDKYEQEADRVAEQVMRMEAPTAPQPIDLVEPELVQMRSPATSITPLQAKSQAPTADPSNNLEDQLNRSKTGGSALPDNVRSYMEPRFGFDFSQVRVHADSEAVQMNQDIGARAFTHGSHIYYGGGQSPADLSLTAHELTHVVQQTGGIEQPAPKLIQRWSPNLPKMPSQYGGLPPYLEKLKDEEQAYFQLKHTFIQGGEDGVKVLMTNVERELAHHSPDDRTKILSNLRSQHDRLKLYGERFLATFESTGKAAIEEMLQASEAAIKQEMKKSGISEELEVVDKPGQEHLPGGQMRETGNFSMEPNNYTEGMAKAAKHLMQENAALMNLQIKLANQYKKEHPAAPMDAAAQQQQSDRAVFTNPEMVEAAQRYEQLYNSYAAQYPTIAAFKQNPEGMAALADGGKSPEATAVIGKMFKEKLKNIEETRQNLADGKLKLWALPNIVQGTKAKMKAESGSVEAKFIDEFTDKKNTDETIRKVAIAAISIALGIIAAVATAGGSLVIAGVATAEGAAISTIQLLETIKEYQVASAASDTDLDKARAVCQEDPSLFWIAVELISIGLDLYAAIGIFRKIAPPIQKTLQAYRTVKAARTAEQVAAGGAEMTAEELQNLKKVMEELDSALEGVPAPIAQKVKARIQDPSKVYLSDKPLSSAGFEGSLAAKGKGFGVYEGFIPGVPDKVVIKVYPDAPEYAEVFAREVAGAKAAASTNMGPKFYGEVNVGAGKKAFAMEKVKGSMPEVVAPDELTGKALADATAEAAHTASKIHQVTIQDVSAYGERMLNRGYYIKGELQGLVDDAGRWRPIDFQGVEKLPDKVADPEAYATALRHHNGHINDQIAFLIEQGPKPLPAAPTGTLPPYRMPSQP